MARSRTRVVVALGIVVAALLPVVDASASYPPLTDPATNIAPQPNFDDSGPCTANAAGVYACANPCVNAQLGFPSTYVNAPLCTNYVLKAIDAADVIDGAAPMTLPSNWYRLSIAEQLFVAANLERIDRGYPPYLGLNNVLDASAQRGASANADPSAVPGFAATTWGGTWSQAFSPLVADYGWMYNDGWGGSAATTSNVDCTSATAPGCWGHRDVLLGWDPKLNFDAGLACVNCEMGAAFAVVNGYGSYDDIVARPTGAPPATSFTWRNEVPYFPPGSPAASTSGPTTTVPSNATTTTESPTTIAPVVEGPIVVAARRLATSGRVVRVRWWTSHALDVTAARLVLYADRYCTNVLAVAIRRFSTHPTSGRLAAVLPRNAGPARRSWRVAVVDGSRRRWGACVAYGA